MPLFCIHLQYTARWPFSFPILQDHAAKSRPTVRLQLASPTTRVAPCYRMDLYLQKTEHATAAAALGTQMAYSMNSVLG